MVKSQLTYTAAQISTLAKKDQAAKRGDVFEDKKVVIHGIDPWKMVVDHGVDSRKMDVNVSINGSCRWISWWFDGNDHGISWDNNGLNDVKYIDVYLPVH